MVYNKISLLFSPVFSRCLQNYIPPQSLTLSCPVCRQTSILPEKGVAALQNNFFITNLMEVLQRDPECSPPEACSVLESVSAAAACQPLSCPNHEGKVGFYYPSTAPSTPLLPLCCNSPAPTKWER